LPLLGEFARRARERGPLIIGRAPDRRRPPAPVQFAAEVVVVFELAEVRQYVFPGPPARPALLPLVVVLRDAAQRDHAHYGGATSNNVSLVVAGQRGVVPGAPVRLQARPHVGFVVIGRRIGIENVGGLLTRRSVL